MKHFPDPHIIVPPVVLVEPETVDAKQRSSKGHRQSRQVSAEYIRYSLTERP